MVARKLDLIVLIDSALSYNFKRDVYYYFFLSHDGRRCRSIEEDLIRTVTSASEAIVREACGTKYQLGV